MDKILLITNIIDKNPTGGRELLCKLNHDIFKELYHNNCMVYELPKHTIRTIKDRLLSFIGYIDGISHYSVQNICKIIEVSSISKVFIDGSNLGGLVKIIKLKYPNIKVYTFFHNIEVRFFLGSFKKNKSFHTLMVLLINYLAERKSVLYSDNIICINQRDSYLLKNIYGKKANNIYPMSLEDKYSKKSIVLSDSYPEKYALFVGGTFYANQAGILWYVENVAPFIDIKTYIVGRGFEKFKNQLEIHSNIVVIGEVDSLEEWYQNAYFVVAPIFDGSGMKTKVAEALMYGKKIIGTQEAFTGYEEFIEKVGRVCQSADDFINAIKSSDVMVSAAFDKSLRKIYEENYSLNAAKLRIKSIMEEYYEN